MAIRLAIAGASGRLGRLIAEHAARDPRFALCALLVSPGSSLLGQLGPDHHTAYASTAQAHFDVLIDVSLPAALSASLAAVSHFGGALVSGVTGYSQTELQTLAGFSETHPLLHTHNFSRGIAVMRHLTQIAARLLGPDFDVGIVDIHHRHKRDAPSGTALSLEAAALAGGAQAVQHSALRIGAIVGEHQLHFAGPAESLCITHHAGERAMFALGALDAAAWITQRESGRYEIAQVFGVAD
jgi:4-hydroxy-tetrahydrodipicolinate reductase